MKALGLILFILFTTQTQAHIFGRDNRREFNPTQFPFTTVGLLLTNQGRCTGTLVSDYLVLTNAHCLINEKGEEVKKIEFIPAYHMDKKRKYILTGKVKYLGSRQPEKRENEKNDWGLVELSSPAGQEFGYLGWKTLAPKDYAYEPLIFIGYSFSFRSGHIPSIQSNCFLRKKHWYWDLYKVNNLSNHDCDTTSGYSGSPLISGLSPKDARIVGLNSIEIGEVKEGEGYTRENPNLAVKPRYFASKIKELRDQEKNSKPLTTLQVCNDTGDAWIRVRFYDEEFRNPGGKPAIIRVGGKGCSEIVFQKVGKFINLEAINDSGEAWSIPMPNVEIKTKFFNKVVFKK